MPLNLKPNCPTCNAVMRELKQTSAKHGVCACLTKGYCKTCKAWKTLTPEIDVKQGKL
jgi:hypothetical protein